MSHQERLHHALASPVRTRVLGALRSHDEPLDVQRLAEIVGIHHNTVRLHLGVLEEAGLVASEPQARDRPGRPRLLYHATAQAAQVEENSPGYRFLATMLADHLAGSSRDAAAAAEGVGAAWGRHLVERPRPSDRIGAGAAVERLVAVLEELGFAPELHRGDDAAPQVDLRRCPFLDVAREHQEVVCSIHLGLMRGALEELGAGVEARELIPFVEPSRCETRLSVPA